MIVTPFFLKQYEPQKLHRNDVCYSYNPTRRPTRRPTPKAVRSRLEAEGGAEGGPQAILARGEDPVGVAHH